jgi:hypothetical protein
VVPNSRISILPSQFFLVSTNYCFVCLFLHFFCGTGAWTQGLHLEPLHQPYFCERFFRDKVLRTICLGWVQTMILLISVSWIARITGVICSCWYFLSNWNPMSVLISSHFPQRFSYSSFQVSDLILRSLMHLKLILIWGEKQISVFYMWISSFSNIICWRGCLFSNKCFQHLCQKSVAVAG